MHQLTDMNISSHPTLVKKEEFTVEGIRQFYITVEHEEWNLDTLTSTDPHHRKEGLTLGIDLSYSYVEHKVEA